jgi:hypothetical protein
LHLRRVRQFKFIGQQQQFNNLSLRSA